MSPVLALLVLAAVAGVVGTWLAVGGLRRAFEARLGATDAEVRRLADAAFVGERGSGQLRQEVAAVRQALERVQVQGEERRQREEVAWQALHRVTSVLAGSQGSGRAGENVLGEALSQLPPSVVERDFRVGGRVVEFALVLADGRRLPIDSKWPAEREVALLGELDDGPERDRVVQAVERTVARRAREVAAYRDPAVTAPLVLAAIPDAAYAVLRRAHADAFRQGVVVVPYSLALPIALSLYSLVARLGDPGDGRACLADLGLALDAMQDTLENKLERAATMLGNGTVELRGHIGQARTAVARARDPSERVAEPVRPQVVGIP